MVDNRRHPRADVGQRLWCETEASTLYVRAGNVSAGGMFIRTASPAEVGQRLRISFEDRVAGPVVAEAEVVWARTADEGGGPGMGVRILAFERGDASYRRFVKTVLGRGGEGTGSGSTP